MSVYAIVHYSTNKKETHEKKSKSSTDSKCGSSQFKEIEACFHVGRLVVVDLSSRILANILLCLMHDKFHFIVPFLFSSCFDATARKTNKLNSKLNFW